MNQYLDWKDHQKNERKQFNYGFLWSYDDKEQYTDMMYKWNLDPKADFNKITRINHFTFLPNEQAEEYYQLLSKQKSVFYSHIQDDKSGLGFIKDMFLTTLWNSKYIYNHNLKKVILLCDIHVEALENLNVKNGFIKALSEYLDSNEVIDELPFYIHEFEYQLDQILEETRKQRIMEEPAQYAAKSYLFSKGISLDVNDRMKQLLHTKQELEQLLHSEIKDECLKNEICKKLELMENLYYSFSSIERPEWMDINSINEYSIRLNFSENENDYKEILDFINVYNEFNAREYDMQKTVVTNWSKIPLAMTEGGSDNQFIIQVNLNYPEKLISTLVDVEGETMEINPIQFETHHDLIVYFQDLDFEWLVNEGLFFCDELEEGMAEMQI